jgi:hypothetical protein
VRDTHRSAVRVLVSLEALVFLAVGAYGLLPPEALPATAGARDFSAGRAIDHVTSIAQEPHPMGSPANARVRDYIVKQLEKLGLEPLLQAIQVPDYYGDPTDTLTLVNVAAVLPGVDPTGAVALMGHYDTVLTTPGANDDSAAVAAILETARALRTGPPLRNDVILLFTDGEEPAPRYGASAFIEQNPLVRRIRLIVNFEAVGSAGPSTLVEIGGPGSWLVTELAEAVHHPVMFSFLTETIDAIGGSDSDVAPFREEGVPALHFAYLHGSPIYHTARDVPERVSLRSLQHQGSNALAVARHFGDLDLTRQPTGDGRIFFSLFGRLVLQYPEDWALPSAVMAGLALGGAIALRAPRRKRWARSLLIGSATVLVTVLCAAVAATLIWQVLARARKTPGIVESYLYLVGIITLSAGISVPLRRAVVSRLGHPDIAGGAVLVWWVLGAITGVWLPGASYLFVWPAFAASLVLAWSGRVGPKPAGEYRPTIWFAAVAAPAILLLVPCIDTFFQMAQPRPGNPDSEVLVIISIAAALASLVIELTRPFSSMPQQSP